MVGWASYGGAFLVVALVSLSPNAIGFKGLSAGTNYPPYSGATGMVLNGSSIANCGKIRPIINPYFGAHRGILAVDFSVHASVCRTNNLGSTRGISAALQDTYVIATIPVSFSGLGLPSSKNPHVLTINWTAKVNASVSVTWNGSCHPPVIRSTNPTSTEYCGVASGIYAYGLPLLYDATQNAGFRPSNSYQVFLDTTAQYRDYRTCVNYGARCWNNVTSTSSLNYSVSGSTSFNGTNITTGSWAGAKSNDTWQLIFEINESAQALAWSYPHFGFWGRATSLVNLGTKGDGVYLTSIKVA